MSVEGLEAGASITAGDITLPKGTTLAVEADTVVLQVIGAQASQADADAEAAEAAAEA